MVEASVAREVNAMAPAALAWKKAIVTIVVREAIGMVPEVIT